MSTKPGLLIPTARRSSYGFFSLTAMTGILAVGLAAETASAGHVIAVRNSKSASFHVTFARLKWVTTTPPSTGQEVGAALKKLTAYEAAHTGGTAVNLFARDV